MIIYIYLASDILSKKLAFRHLHSNSILLGGYCVTHNENRAQNVVHNY